MIRWAATDHKCALSISTVAQNQYPWVLKPIFAQQSLAFSWLEQPPWSVQEELWAWKVSQTLHIRHLDSWEMPLSFQTFQILNRESSGLVWTLSPVCMEMSKAIAKGSGLEGHKCAQTLSRDEKSNVRPSLEREILLWMQLSLLKDAFLLTAQTWKETRLSVATFRFSVFDFGYDFRSLRKCMFLLTLMQDAGSERRYWIAS